MAAKSFDKLIEEIGNLSVFELNELVKSLETAFGVSAAMPMAAAAPAAGSSEAPKQEEQATYKLTLESCDDKDKKIAVIKALRVVKSDMTLPDAKNAVENAPTVIFESLPKEEAAKAKKTLEDAGAKVKLS
jgi:large subunit ribosomal protein L7/L12